MVQNKLRSHLTYRLPGKKGKKKSFWGTKGISQQWLSHDLDVLCWSPVMAQGRTRAVDVDLVSPCVTLVQVCIFRFDCFCLSGHLMGKKSIEEYPYLYDAGERASAMGYLEGDKPVAGPPQWREALLTLLRMIESSDSRNSPAMRDPKIYSRKMYNSEDNVNYKEVSYLFVFGFSQNTCTVCLI